MPGFESRDFPTFLQSISRLSGKDLLRVDSMPTLVSTWEAALGTPYQGHHLITSPTKAAATAGERRATLRRERAC